MTPRRRRLLLGAGAVAASAGACLGVWLGRDDGPAKHPVFGRRFPTPAGGDLDMATFLGRPLLLNFWATWCPPCVREMPLLDRFHRAHAAQGWRVVGLAIDRPGARARIPATRLSGRFSDRAGGLRR
jgi:thiol-disulfide isomerase/thioredoxin